MELVLKGFIISGGLSIVIGAQNAFLLKHGLQAKNIFLVSLIFFVCDIILMTIGVMGVGTIIRSSIILALLLALSGALFLIWYGIRSFLNAFKSTAILGKNSNTKIDSGVKVVILSALGVTFLNPNVYIDTIFIIGGIAGTMPLQSKILFLLGAFIASFIWFFGFGYGARLLRPFFMNEKSWRFLEFLVGIIMFYIAFELLLYVVKIVKT
jgi:L-lysine exporter family protein LysE/ArgO